MMKVLDSLLYRMVRVSVRLLGSLPDVIPDCSAAHLGRILFALDRRHRRIAICNLTFAFGDEKSPAEIFAIARRVFCNLGRIFFEIAWAARLPEHRFADHFSISGLGVYKKAVSRGKGVLFLVAHFGNWELLPIIAHMCRIPAQIVYRPLDAPFLERIVQEYRCRFGAKTIANRKGGMRQVLRALHQGLPVAMLMDQNVDWYDGVFVDFFGHRACTNKGMALLALKSQAPVLPVFLIRRAKGFHAVMGT